VSGALSLPETEREREPVICAVARSHQSSGEDTWAGFSGPPIMLEGGRLAGLRVLSRAPIGLEPPSAVGALQAGLPGHFVA